MMTNAAFLVIGLLAGGVFFALLRWNTALYLREGGFARAVGLQVLRLAAVAFVLTLAARHGALPLLLGAAGLLVARTLVVRLMAPVR